jgi:hypothetical protein
LCKHFFILRFFVYHLPLDKVEQEDLAATASIAYLKKRASWESIGVKKE